MKQNVPFLPRLKMTRHLSTIVEGREDNEEYSHTGGQCGKLGENRHRRRVYSCSDIPVARNWRKERDDLILPPLANPEKAQRHEPSRGNGKGPRGNQKEVGCTDRIFPDFMPPDTAWSFMDFDSKASRHCTRSKLNTEDSFSHNKENIVASWLQFFG